MKQVKDMAEFGENFKEGKGMVNSDQQPVRGRYKYTDYVQRVKDGKIFLAPETETVTVTYPKAETEPLEIGLSYWTLVTGQIVDVCWDDDYYDRLRLKAGLVWLDKEHAEAFLKAISGVNDE